MSLCKIVVKKIYCMLYMYLLLVLQYYHWVLYIVQYFDILFSTEDNVILVQHLHLHRLKANKTSSNWCHPKTPQQYRLSTHGIIFNGASVNFTWDKITLINMEYILTLYGLTWISYKLTFHNILASAFQTCFYNNVNWMQASDRFIKGLHKERIRWKSHLCSHLC